MTNTLLKILFLQLKSCLGDEFIIGWWTLYSGRKGIKIVCMDDNNKVYIRESDVGEKRFYICTDLNIIANEFLEFKNFDTMEKQIKGYFQNV